MLIFFINPVLHAPPLSDVSDNCTSCHVDELIVIGNWTGLQSLLNVSVKYISKSELGIKPNVQTSSRLPHWADGLDLKTLPDKKADVLLFVGRGANQIPEHAESARKLAKLLQHAHIDFGILEGDEPVSGIEYYWTGYLEEFYKAAHTLTNQINQTNVKKIVILCGEDLGMLRSKYPRFSYEVKAEVIHASEFLLTLIKKGKLRLTTPINYNVSYHDPCYLGRQSEPIEEWEGEELQTHGVMRYFVPPKPIAYGVNGVFDAPRNILSAIPGLSFIEMHRIREYAYCCGGGGGVPGVHPNVSKSAAIQRIDEARDVDADILVTACQHCIHNLTRWQSEDNSLPVVDLVDLVYESTGLE